MRPIEWLFPVALLLYSVSIWSSKIKGVLRPWMVWVFGMGLAADIAGTVFLCVVSTTVWKISVHGVSGFASLVLMAIHFGWALAVVLAWPDGKSKIYFNRFSVPTWALWLIAFSSGLIVGH